MVRAKFTVQSRTESADGTFSITLLPVTSGSDENKQFYKWTPAGNIVLNTINKCAGEKLVPGKEYYVDFTEAV